MAEQTERIVKPARICGYVGQTVVIYERTDRSVYCNFKENRGCDMNTEFCRLRDAILEQDAARTARAAGESDA